MKKHLNVFLIVFEITNLYTLILSSENSILPNFQTFKHSKLLQKKSLLRFDGNYIFMNTTYIRQ